MPKRSSKPRKSKKKPEPDRDENEIAAAALRHLTGSASPPPADPDKEMVSRVMAAMGRKGGLKGGKARADSLTAKRRKDIAKRAAEARWKNRADRD